MIGHLKSGLRAAMPLRPRPRAGRARPHRLAQLDGLRAVAALAVLAYHFADGQVAHYGTLGVELFFVISGFVIFMTLERAPTIRDFAISRAARLYPAYWLSVAFCGATFLLIHSGLIGRPVDVTSTLDPNPHLGSALLNLTMLQRFIGQHDLQTVYWTLALELWFYVVMASLAVTGNLRRVEWLALAWLFLMGAARMVLPWLHHSPMLAAHPRLQVLLMPLFGQFFIAGMMIYRLHTGQGTRPTVLTLAAAVAFSLFGRPDGAQIPPLPYLIATALIVGAVWLAASGRLTVLASSACVALGRRSYSLYLLHFPVLLMAVQFCVWLDQPRWLAVSIALPAALGLATLSWRYVEAPAMAWVKRDRRAGASDSRDVTDMLATPDLTGRGASAGRQGFRGAAEVN